MRTATSVLTQPRPKPLASSGMSSLDLLEQADYILWQARSLVEWRRFFHSSSPIWLRFCRAEKVVESETAALLLGCDSVNHPVVEQLVPVPLGARIPLCNSNRD